MQDSDSDHQSFLNHLPNSKKKRKQVFKFRRKAGRAQQWSLQKNIQLIQLVKQYGQSWSFIAKMMGEKSSKKCRDKWNNNVDPRVCRQEFSFYQSWVLFLSSKTLGPKWVQISKLMYNRSEIQLKSEWYTKRMQKKIPYFEQRFKTILKQSVQKALDEVTQMNEQK